MAKQVINIGAAPNDGTGTPLRTSFDYTNQNFTELYNGSGIGTSTNTQVLFNDSGVANGDAGLVYNKTTDALTLGGNVVMASAKGIDFSATAGAGTSELLNDYEEGTWSPTPSGEVNLTSVVSVSGQYTKVGRLVTVSGHVTATVTLASTLTSFRLPTLPFANGATTVGTVFADGSLKAGGAQVFGNGVAGYFPAASALAAGAAVFYYSVTYST